MSLPESLERAASELGSLADQIRPANGDPHRLLDELNTEEAAQLLGWILREEPEAAEELILVWGEADAGAAILVAVSDVGVAKAARKLLRTARHRLRSQGVEFTTSEPSTKSPRRPASTESDRFEAAHVSIPDFRGGRVGYLVESHPAGGVRLFEIRFDETRGILDFKLYSAGRSKVRGFLRTLTAGTGHRLFEVGQRDVFVDPPNQDTIVVAGYLAVSNDSVVLQPGSTQDRLTPLGFDPADKITTEFSKRSVVAIVVDHMSQRKPGTRRRPFL